MGRCYTPYTLKDDNINVPCGKCYNCKARRASAWSFRLMYESRRAQTANFITLTYDTNHVPITTNGFMGLKKEDLQLFFKRLRQAHVRDARKHNVLSPTLKYYACGEYGTYTKRPHYHIILFNAQLELIQPCWQLGHTHYGDVKGASIGYTLKYITKSTKVPEHQRDDRQKEFAVMSKGLGSNYLESEMVNWHVADINNRLYIPIEDGKKIPMPRYLREKIYTQEERNQIMEHVAQKMEEQEQRLIKHYGPERYMQLLKNGQQAIIDRALFKERTQGNKI